MSTQAPDLTISTTAGPPTRARSILSEQGFRNLFLAAAVSTTGTQISFLAVPLLAVTVLSATPLQVGVLGGLKTIAFLLVGLPAGAWLDRVRRRGVMVAADLARAVLFGSVAAAWALNLLTIWQLYVVVLAAGLATLFFDIAVQSYLPALVGRDRLADANGKLQSWDAAAQVAGPSAAGYLVQVFSAPFAILIDALTFLWSGLFVARIRKRESEPERRMKAPLFSEIREGVGFVFGHPLLRPIAMVGAGTNLFIQIAIITMPLMYKRELNLSDGELGLFFTFGGFGVLLGSVTAKRLSDRFGYGRVLWIAGLVVMPFGLLVPFIDGGALKWVAMCGWLALTYRIGMNNVLLVSIRQRVTPDRLLSRMNATTRFLMTGALAVGAAVAGFIGQYAGIRPALWVAAIGLSAAWLPMFFSPLRAMRGLPPAAE